jgi:hypothetical protein
MSRRGVVGVCGRRVMLMAVGAARMRVRAERIAARRHVLQIMVAVVGCSLEGVCGIDQLAVFELIETKVDDDGEKDGRCRWSGLNYLNWVKLK